MRHEDPRSRDRGGPTWGAPGGEDAPRAVERVEPTDVVPGEELAPDDERVLEQVMAAADAENTTEAYRTDLRQFAEWCRRKGLRSFSRDRAAAPKVVALWATSLAQEGRKIATIKRKLSAVSSAHTRLGLDSPCRKTVVKRTLAGLKRKLGVEQDQVDALEAYHLRKIVAAAKVTLRWKRDRAILLLGFACAMRREEVARVRLENVEFGTDRGGHRGLSVFLPSSKTDQEGRGEWKHVPENPGNTLCPVRAFRAWIKRSGIVRGYVFRRIHRNGKIEADDEKHLTPKSVLTIVRKAVSRIGEDPERFGGHSLRAGLVTTAKGKGKDNSTIKRQTGHRRNETLDKYNRPTDLYGPSNPIYGLFD